MDSEPCRCYHTGIPFSALLLTAAPSDLVFPLLLTILLIACSGLISGSEIAFFSLTQNDIEALKNEKSEESRRVLDLLDTSRYLLATILIANNFVNIAIAVVSGYILGMLLPEPLLLSWGQFLQGTFAAAPEKIAANIRFLIEIGVVTSILVLFGEVMPKVYANLNPRPLLRIMTRPFLVLRWLFYPLNKFLVEGTRIIERRLNRNAKPSNARSLQEIDQAIELTVSHEMDSAQDVGILKSIVKFSNITVRQIMRTRVDVAALDLKTPFDELLDIVKDMGFSRYPVYEDDLDSVVGLLHVKDLLPFLSENKDFEWQPYISTEVPYVPESKRINDLLKEFQDRRVHMAIVADEFGGTAGIVTLEDIMEEIIGEIKDEFDDVELEYKKLDAHNYVFEGKTMLNDVCRIVGIDTSTFDEAKGDADSLAGLMLEILGHLPQKDEMATFEGFQFKVLSANKRRIEKLQMTLPNTSGEQS